ncbi:MAG: hypothetical protein V3T49_07155 [Dehalococcoidia bacterium]
MNHVKWAVIMFAALAVAAISVACSSSTETSTVQSGAATEQPRPTASQPDPTATQIAPTATQQAGDSQLAKIQPIEMTVLFPADGETLKTDIVRVLVEASLDSQIDINGVIATANVDGTFHADLVLDDGLNFIEITGINSDGSVDNEQLVVIADFSSVSAALSIVSPEDGAITTATSIEITGIASLDSVIQVNGIGATPDSSGIFQVTVELETGSNLIEIISINLSGESVTEELVIFSQPE